MFYRALFITLFFLTLVSGSVSAQSWKIVECEMINGWNSNGTIPKKLPFLYDNGNIKYLLWNDKEEKNEWVKANKISEEEFDWVVELSFGKITYNLKVDAKIEDILLNVVLYYKHAGRVQRHGSKGKCKKYSEG